MLTVEAESILTPSHGTLRLRATHQQRNMGEDLAKEETLGTEPLQQNCPSTHQGLISLRV